MEKPSQETARTEHGKETDETSTTGEEPGISTDLPTDVRVKLRKLEKFESRYHGAYLDGLGTYSQANLLKSSSGRTASPMLGSSLLSLSKPVSEKTPL